MKISKIYISAFGGLKDFTLDLSDGLNVIFGENEQGKTTVMAFIRAMFYGTGKKTQSLETSTRVKYTPMDGSAMGGRIWFEQGGRSFCLERHFNKSDATDKTTLTDMDTGEKAVVTTEIGAHIFGIGGEAFKKSMFISSERNYDVDEAANGDLNARLSAVALTGSDDMSFQKIEKRIRTAKEKVLSKTEKAGALALLRKQREDLEEQYDKAVFDAKRKLELHEKMTDAEEKLNLTLKKTRAIKHLLDKKDDAKNAEKLTQYLELKTELDKISGDLLTPLGTNIDSNFISKVKFCKSKADNENEQVIRLTKELETLENAEKMSESMDVGQAEEKHTSLKADIKEAETEKEKIMSQIELAKKELSVLQEYREKQENEKKPLNLPLIIVGIALLVFGIAGALAINNIFYALAAVGLITAILSFVFKLQNRSKEFEIQGKIADTKEKIATLKNEESVISTTIMGKTGEINTLVAVLSADKTVREKRLEDIKAKKEQLFAAKQKADELFNEYKKALDGLEEDEEKLSEISKKVEIQKDIKLRLNYLSKDLGGISYEEAGKKLGSITTGEDLSNIDFEKAQAEYDKLSERAIELNREKAEYETELRTSFRNLPVPETVKREIDELDEKIEAAQAFVEGCEVCLETLNESFSNIRKGYGSELNEKTLEYFTKLTDGKYKAVNVNKSLQIEVEKSDSFGMFETGYLSTGTEDQAFLALRLAICDMISTKEPYPVFLDDALSNYDDRRSEIALEFLKQYSEKSQVILFTCHGKIADISSNLGTNVKKLG